MHAPRTVTTLMVSIAAAGALLLAGCGSGTTASTPTAATSAAAPVPEVSSAAPAPSAPMSSAPAEAPAEVVVATWTCVRDGDEVTCTCEGSEVDCKSAVTEPSTVKGAGGKVKWFNSVKGFGFITPANGGPDVFVHISAVEAAGLSSLANGQVITYELVRDPTNGKAYAWDLRTW